MTVLQTTQSSRPETSAKEVSASGIKSILLHIQNERSLENRLETALAIARACRAHVKCLHIVPIEAYVAFETFGGVFVMNDVMKAVDEEAARLRDTVERALAFEDVSWDYEQATGNVAGIVSGYAALADLVVTDRDSPGSDSSGAAMILLGDILQWSPTPLFIPATGSRSIDVTGPALIAWDGSREAANAVRSSIGLLKMASDVRALHVRQSSEKPGEFPGTRLLEYLSRHAIHAELTVEESGKAFDDEDFVAAGLIGHARSAGGAYVVMGGYGHSRIAEFLFGGVTRRMLSQASVPLVIAH